MTVTQRDVVLSVCDHGLHKIEELPPGDPGREWLRGILETFRAGVADRQTTPD